MIGFARLDRFSGAIALCAAAVGCGTHCEFPLPLDTGQPVVRSTVVSPASIQVVSGKAAHLVGAVDADSGLSLGIRWESTDTTIVRVLDTLSNGGTRVRISAAPRAGQAYVCAISVANVAVKGCSRVTVTAQ